MDSWPSYEISTLFTSASPGSFFALETRTSQSQTGSHQNWQISVYFHRALLLCISWKSGALTDFGCLGSIGEILLSVTVMKVLNNFFKHWLILEEMGEGGTTGQSILRRLVLVLATNLLGNFKHLTLFAWSLFPLLHCSTASMSVKAEYNEIHLLYKTFQRSDGVPYMAARY